MEILRRPGQYEQPRTIGKTLQQMQSQRLNTAGIAHQIVRDETLFDILFTCLSPLELCQYILAKGVRKDGSKALF